MLDRKDRICLGELVDKQGGPSTASELRDLLSVLVEQTINLDGRLHCLIRGIPHPLQKEIQPFFPSIILAGSVEPVIVQPTMFLEE